MIMIMILTIIIITTITNQPFSDDMQANTCLDQHHHPWKVITFLIYLPPSCPPFIPKLFMGMAVNFPK